MNVIDFHVTKILSEKYGKVYELYGMTLAKRSLILKAHGENICLVTAYCRSTSFGITAELVQKSVSAHLQMLIIPAMLVSTKRLYSLIEKGYL